jgi:hypothetical protein
MKRTERVNYENDLYYLVLPGLEWVPPICCGWAPLRPGDRSDEPFRGPFSRPPCSFIGSSGIFRGPNKRQQG